MRRLFSKSSLHKSLSRLNNTKHYNNTLNNIAENLTPFFNLKNWEKIYVERTKNLL